MEYAGRMIFPDLDVPVAFSDAYVIAEVAWPSLAVHVMGDSRDAL
jgi:hypothetical protein